MAGSILQKEQSALILTSTGVSLTSGSAALAGQLDVRAAGNAADQFLAAFSLTAQWATPPSGAGTLIAELYLVPAIDGTNFPDIDLTGGASYIPFTMRAGSFVAAKTPGTSVNAVFQSNTVDLLPALYNVYVLNRSGQTMSANWILKALAAAAQYT
jgi:hypothetical protein